jgi:hypothetical protein
MYHCLRPTNNIKLFAIPEIKVFYDMTACSLVYMFQYFWGRSCLHLSSKRRQQISPKRWYISIKRCVVTFQKAIILVLTAPWETQTWQNCNSVQIAVGFKIFFFQIFRFFSNEVLFDRHISDCTPLVYSSIILFSLSLLPISQYSYISYSINNSHNISFQIVYQWVFIIVSPRKQMEQRSTRPSKLPLVSPSDIICSLCWHKNVIYAEQNII